MRNYSPHNSGLALSTEKEAALTTVTAGCKLYVTKPDSVVMNAIQYIPVGRRLWKPHAIKTLYTSLVNKDKLNKAASHVERNTLVRTYTPKRHSWKPSKHIKLR